jgi:hypothetical protein
MQSNHRNAVDSLYAQYFGSTLIIAPIEIASSDDEITEVEVLYEAVRPDQIIFDRERVLKDLAPDVMLRSDAMDVVVRMAVAMAHKLNDVAVCAHPVTVGNTSMSFDKFRRDIAKLKPRLAYVVLNFSDAIHWGLAARRVDVNGKATVTLYESTNNPTLRKEAEAFIISTNFFETASVDGDVAFESIPAQHDGCNCGILVFLFVLFDVLSIPKPLEFTEGLLNGARGVARKLVATAERRGLDAVVTLGSSLIFSELEDFAMSVVLPDVSATVLNKSALRRDLVWYDAWGETRLVVGDEILASPAEGFGTAAYSMVSITRFALHKITQRLQTTIKSSSKIQIVSDAWVRRASDAKFVEALTKLYDHKSWLQVFKHTQCKPGGLLALELERCANAQIYAGAPLQESIVSMIDGGHVRELKKIRTNAFGQALDGGGPLPDMLDTIFLEADGVGTESTPVWGVIQTLASGADAVFGLGLERSQQDNSKIVDLTPISKEQQIQEARMWLNQ